MRRKVLVVDYQLDELTNAVEGASVLFHCLRTDQLGTEDQVVAAERAALSVLDLTVAHMRQLIRALRFQIDASDILTAQNSTSPSPALKEQHAVLVLPGGKERADLRHREQVARARRSVRAPSKKKETA